MTNNSYQTNTESIIKGNEMDSLQKMNRNDVSPYEILQISTDATLEEIKNAYRSLAKIHHPDKGGDAQIFKTIKVAFQMVIDNIKKGTPITKQTSSTFMEMKEASQNFQQVQKTMDPQEFLGPNTEFDQNVFNQKFVQNSNDKEDYLLSLISNESDYRENRTQQQLLSEQAEIENELGKIKPLFTKEQFNNNAFQRMFEYVNGSTETKSLQISGEPEALVCGLQPFTEIDETAKIKQNLSIYGNFEESFNGHQNPQNIDPKLLKKFTKQSDITDVNQIEGDYHNKIKKRINDYQSLQLNYHSKPTDTQQLPDQIRPSQVKGEKLNQQKMNQIYNQKLQERNQLTNNKHQTENYNQNTYKRADPVFDHLSKVQKGIHNMGTNDNLNKMQKAIHSISTNDIQNYSGQNRSNDTQICSLYPTTSERNDQNSDSYATQANGNMTVNQSGFTDLRHHADQRNGQFLTQDETMQQVNSNLTNLRKCEVQQHIKTKSQIGYSGVNSNIAQTEHTSNNTHRGHLVPDRNMQLTQRLLPIMEYPKNSNFQTTQQLSDIITHSQNSTEDYFIKIPTASQDYRQIYHNTNKFSQISPQMPAISAQITTSTPQINNVPILQSNNVPILQSNNVPILQSNNMPIPQSNHIAISQSNHMGNSQSNNFENMRKQIQNLEKTLLQQSKMIKNLTQTKIKVKMSKKT